MLHALRIAYQSRASKHENWRVRAFKNLFKNNKRNART